MARKRTHSNNYVESLDEDCDCCEEIEINESDDVEGTPIASFNFLDNSTAASLNVGGQANLIETPDKAEPFLDRNITVEKPSENDNKKLTYGITPPVDGEYFEVRRTFLFRKSTVKLLNKIKAIHQDENVYLSSIVDSALRQYYDYLLVQNNLS